MALTSCAVPVPTDVRAKVEAGSELAEYYPLIEISRPAAIHERVSKQILSHVPSAEPVGYYEFLQAIGEPERQITVGDLSTPEVRKRIARTELDIVITVAAHPKYGTSEFFGYFVIVGRDDFQLEYHIAIVNVAGDDNPTFTHLVSGSEGGAVLVGAPPFVVGVGRDTAEYDDVEAAAVDALAEAIVASIGATVAGGRMRFVVTGGNAHIAMKLLLISKSRPGAEAGDAELQWKLYQHRDLLTGREGLTWLCRSADAGYPEARIELSRLYWYGLEALPEDRSRSFMWSSLAAVDGHEGAKIDVQERRKLMSRQELSSADHLINEWKPGDCATEIAATGSGANQ